MSASVAERQAGLQLMTILEKLLTVELVKHDGNVTRLHPVGAVPAPGLCSMRAGFIGLTPETRQEVPTGCRGRLGSGGVAFRAV